MNVLVTAASRQGATYEIAEAIGRVLRERGLDSTVSRPGVSTMSPPTTPS